MPSTASSFDNINDELEYYKTHAEEVEQELAETRYALEEFQLSSKELEEELEKEIDSTERRYNEIKIRNESMRQEVEEWKVQYPPCVYPTVLHGHTARANISFTASDLKAKATIG
jgi:hypothetical protein